LRLGNAARNLGRSEYLLGDLFCFCPSEARDASFTSRLRRSGQTARADRGTSPNPDDRQRISTRVSKGAATKCRCLVHMRIMLRPFVALSHRDLTRRESSRPWQTTVRSASSSAFVDQGPTSRSRRVAQRSPDVGRVGAPTPNRRHGWTSPSDCTHFRFGTIPSPVHGQARRSASPDLTRQWRKAFCPWRSRAAGLR
jgi:hypothetical protein